MNKLGFEVIRENYREARNDWKLGLRVNDTTELEIFGVVRELEAKGIEVEPLRYDDFTGKKMTFFHDPDGLPLEAHE